MYVCVCVCVKWDIFMADDEFGSFQFLFDYY